MNLTLIWLMALPIIGAAVVYYMNRETHPWFVGPVAALPGMALIGIVFAVSYGSAVIDTEIWNGKVVSKNREHGSYQRSYECMCTTSTDSKGNTTRSCQTCYEDHYTVNWTCNTTIGQFTIDSEDSTSRRVYDTPDPQRYTIIKAGDPAAKTSSYTNYVQAVPHSLFAAMSDVEKRKFAGKLPAYPDKVFDHYRINRFVSTGFAFTDAQQWNDDISLMLRDLGPQKQVNVIVVVAKTDDRAFVPALREHWEGANKNDVVLVIGSLDGRKIEFVDVISWTKSEIFKVQLVDRIRDIGLIERTQVMSALQDQIAKNFERRRMREFEYLKGEIDPPEWLIWTLVVVLVIGYAAGALGLNRVAGPTFGRRMVRRWS